MHEEGLPPELTEVVARLSPLLGPRAGGVTALDGGMTNRNLRMSLGGEDYVVRLPGKRSELLGIDRQAERIANEAAAELGFAPRVAALLEEPPCLVTRFVKGRELSPEELRGRARGEQVARHLRAFHDSGTALPTRFDTVQLVEDYAALAREHGSAPPDGFEATRRQALAIRDAVAGHPEHAPVCCHDDLLPTNFLLEEGRILIIDWEYAGMGDRWFDLGNFAVNNELGDDDEERLLAAYFGEPPGPRRRAALKLFRFMSDLREAMWGVVQTGISELDFDFPGYARKHFERLDAAAADPSFARWVDEAAA